MVHVLPFVAVVVVIAIALVALAEFSRKRALAEFSRKPEGLDEAFERVDSSGVILPAPVEPEVMKPRRRKLAAVARKPKSTRKITARVPVPSGQRRVSHSRT